MSQLRPRAESPCRTEPPPRAERVALCTACSNTDVTEVRGSVRRCKSAESVPAHAPGALGGRSWSAEKASTRVPAVLTAPRHQLQSPTPWGGLGHGPVCPARQPPLS